MPRTVYRTSIVLHALWFLGFLATSPAGAGDSRSGASDDFDRWIPSLGVTLGFTTQEHKGTVDASEQRLTFGGIIDIPLGDRVFADGRKLANNLVVGGTAELQTPELLPFRWSPRIFIGGEIMHVSSQRRTLAREGNPASIRDPGDNPLPADAILGQGSSVSSDADTILYGASVGLSIPIQIGDWRVSLKPSARYLNQEIDFRGVVLDADRTGILNNQPPTTIVEIRDTDSLEVHALGPGFEIEIDAARVKSIAASIFISGGAYKVLSDRKVSFSKSVRDNLDTGDFRGDFTAEIDPWIFRANLGFRVKWLGFSSGWLGQGD